MRIHRLDGFRTVVFFVDQMQDEPLEIVNSGRLPRLESDEHNEHDPRIGILPEGVLWHQLENSSLKYYCAGYFQKYSKRNNFGPVVEFCQDVLQNNRLLTSRSCLIS